jgi:plastocyanin
MNPLLIGGVIVAILIIGAVVILGMGDKTTTTSETANNSAGNEAAMEAENINTTVDDSGTTVVEVTGGGYAFEPNLIFAKKGQPLKIVLTSTDTMHDFTIDALDVKTEIAQAGDSVEVEFTPNEAGEFEFYCSVGDHKAQGMVGTLVVTD